MKEYKLLINDKWEESKNIKDIRSPYDQAVVGRVHFADKEQMEKAIHAASESFKETKKLSSHERFKMLENISSEIEKRSKELAKSIALSAGKTIKSSQV